MTLKRSAAEVMSSDWLLDIETLKPTRRQSNFSLLTAIKEISLPVSFEQNKKEGGGNSLIFPPASNDEEEPRPMKRRRFQRRNSKTAAMLRSSILSAVPSFENCAKESEEQQRAGVPSSPNSFWEEQDDLVIGLGLGLVKQLKLRRHFQNVESTSA